MTAAAARRRPRPPQLPLFSGRPVSAAELRARAERDRAERSIQQQLIGDLNNLWLVTGLALRPRRHGPNG